MAFRFWRRIRIAPGVTLNLSKSGGSLSFGPGGAKFTAGSRGKRATVGISGTGLFYTQTLLGKGSGGRRANVSTTPVAPSVRAENRLTLGFLKRLVTPGDEEALVTVAGSWSWTVRTRRFSISSRRPIWRTGRILPASWQSKKSGSRSRSLSPACACLCVARRQALHADRSGGQNQIHKRLWPGQRAY